jgi:hypothetical protein
VLRSIDGHKKHFSRSRITGNEFAQNRDGPRLIKVEAVATEMARPAFKRDGAGRGDGNKPEKMQQVSSAS